MPRAIALIAAIIWSLSSAHAVASPGSGIDGFALGSLHSGIAARHPDVAHITADDLVALKSAPANDILILDVREPAEFAVSRIPGALRVAPGITPEALRRQLGDRIADRTVVLYCSVGARSSQLASALVASGEAAAARNVYNLAGGIFNWHNQQRPLVDGLGSTNLVHPYSWTWSRFVTQRKLTRYTPRQSSGPVGAANHTPSKTPAPEVLPAAPAASVK